MIRKKLCLLVILSSYGLVYAEPFFLIAPDKGNQRLLSVAIQATEDGITAQQVKPLPMPFVPVSIVAGSDGRLIVSSSNAKDSSGDAAAQVEVLDGGELRIVKKFALAGPTGYTSIDRTGTHLLYSHYRTGNVGVYRLDKEGGVAERVCSTHTPRTYAHCILTTPDNEFAYVPCVKENNALYQFKFNDNTGQLTPLEPFDAEPPEMYGPRHVAYHPDLRIAYFSNEQQLGVSAYAIEADGQLRATQHVVSVPRRSPYEKGKRDLHASDLIVTPDKNWLFLAVRDFNGDEDSVFTFEIKGDGELRQTQRTKVGDIPWRLALSPDGKYLLVSEAFDHRLSIFQIEPDGSLERAANLDWGVDVRDMVVVDQP